MPSARVVRNDSSWLAGRQFIPLAHATPSLQQTNCFARDDWQASPHKISHLHSGSESAAFSPKSTSTVCQSDHHLFAYLSLALLANSLTPLEFFWIAARLTFLLRVLHGVHGVVVESTAALAASSSRAPMHQPQLHERPLHLK